MQVMHHTVFQRTKGANPLLRGRVALDVLQQREGVGRADGLRGDLGLGYG